MMLKKAPPRREATRARIIAAAKNLFFKDGFAATSMAQISTGVGGSKATLYSHFKSKDDLLLAVVEDVINPINAEIAGAPSPDDFRTWLRWLGEMGLRRLLSDEIIAVRRIATAEAQRFPEFGRVLYELGVVPSFLPLAATVSGAMDRGILRKADPLEAVMLFLEICGGWMQRKVEWNIAPNPDDAEITKAVDRAVEIFMDGYARRPGEHQPRVEGA